jgi:Tol biopolymer transport system component
MTSSRPLWPTRSAILPAEGPFFRAVERFAAPGNPSPGQATKFRNRVVRSTTTASGSTESQRTPNHGSTRGRYAGSLEVPMSKTNKHSVMLIVLAAFSLAFATGVAPQPQQRQAELALKAAMDKEVVDGDLNGAIELYQQLAAGGDRAVAARALVRMGQCYEKLGEAKVTQARAAYEHVVREFGDQSTVATEARARLAALRQASPASTEPTIRARRLLAGSSEDEVDILGGPTPDGRGLVYVDPTAKNLALRDLETGVTRLITNRGSENGFMSYFEIVSPDGRAVAYSWQRRASPREEPTATELRVVGIDGSGDRLLREESVILPRSWSRDGRYIAAVVSGKGSLDTEIVRVSAADGSKTSLMTFHNAGGVIPALAQSPDDRFVAVELPVEDDSGRRDVVLLPTKGGSVVPLVDHPADDRLMGWIPGTNDLLFTSDRSGNPDLWAIRVDTDGRGGAPRPVMRGIGEMSAMGFARDGSLFYSVDTLQYNIFIAPFDEKSGRIMLNEAKPLGGRGSSERPNWSPNGQYLSFARRRTVPPGRTEQVLYVLNTRTGEERALAEHISPATVPSPSWFPDGQSLLVKGMPQDDLARSRGGAPSAAYRVDLATGAATRLFEFPPDRYWWMEGGLSAGPGGDSVLFTSRGRLVLRHLQSGKEEELYRHPNLGGAQLTPDGSHVVFAVRASTESGGPRTLMIMPSTGGEARELVTIENGVRIGWTSDGSHLLFRERGKTADTIMRVAREGGRVEPLSSIQGSVRSLGVSPDGRHVAYWIQENEAEVWVLENIKEALARAK